MTTADRGSEGQFPARRVVLLGASNVIRGISTLLETARRLWGSPLDFMAATGHGRSYGLSSRFMGRSLPPIVSCGLWDDLAARPAAATAALVTDIGNDIVYGADVEQIAAWVDQCLERLSAVSERVVITQLPLESVSGVHPASFLLIRTAFYPRSRLRLSEAISRAEQLNEHVKELARRHRAELVSPRAEWFGVDPIHIRTVHRPAAWREILATWCEGPLPLAAPRSLRQWLYLSRLRPMRRCWLGNEQYQAQPAGRFPDGTTVSFY